MKLQTVKTGAVLFFGVMVLFAAQPQRPDDASVNFWVTRAILEDSRVGPSDITATTMEGIVTLTGNARNLAQKTYAELEATKIKGVFGVINKILVVPVSRPDIEIRQAIRKRIVNSSVIVSELLGVKVNKDEVTLSGKVPSYSEKQEVSFLASEVRGVVSVENNIVVVNPAGRSDAEIGADVRAKIDRDVYLSEFPITVSVEKGVAVLSGEVVSAYEKERATNDALQVSNVADVKNNLKIRWWEISGARTKPPNLSDSVIAFSVASELLSDSRITKPEDVRVRAKSGHVILEGELPTLRQKMAARLDATEVVGVAWVSNLIAVNGPWREDFEIDLDSRFALSSDYALTGDNINLSVNNGTVLLTGNVNSAYEKSQALKDISGIIGVKNIINNIAVNWEAPDFDKALKERIEERFMENWETAPVAGKITATVLNGEATLAGQVDTWAQYAEAAKVAALTMGIRHVENRLSISGMKYPWEKFFTAPADILREPGNTDPWRMYQ